MCWLPCEPAFSIHDQDHYAKTLREYPRPLRVELERTQLKFPGVLVPEDFNPEAGANSFDEFLSRYLAGEQARQLGRSTSAGS